MRQERWVHPYRTICNSTVSSVRLHWAISLRLLTPWSREDASGVSHAGLSASASAVVRLKETEWRTGFERPTTSSEPLVTDFLKLRPLRWGSWRAAAMKNTGQSKRSKSARGATKIHHRNQIPREERFRATKLTDTLIAGLASSEA